MTAPLFLVDPGALTGLDVDDPVELTGPEAHHAATPRLAGLCLLELLSLDDFVVIAEGADVAGEEILGVAVWQWLLAILPSVGVSV